MTTVKRDYVAQRWRSAAAEGGRLEQRVGRSRYVEEVAMVSRIQNGTSPPHSRGCS